MLSPKFPSKKIELKDIVSSSRLKSTWKNRVRDALRRQLIPDPVEHLDFHISLEAQCRSIEAEIYNGGYIPKSPIRFLSEKAKGLCRQIVIPTVKDALVLQALSDALWHEIKGKAPTKNSFYAPADQQFSKHRDVDGAYGSAQAWLLFQSAILGFANERDFLIVTDIANYYDFISHDHLRNILASLSLTREMALDFLHHILSHLLWQPDYMPKIPIGLPQIDLDAPRLLAHCFLFEIDRLLANRRGIDFARYMDDIDIGVDDLPTAKAVIRDLDLSLQTRQVRLNSGKTRILTKAEARRHFKIVENQVIDSLHDEVAEAQSSPANLQLCRLKIERRLRMWLQNGAFLDGNGEKIFKRMIGLARSAQLDIDGKILSTLLHEWPALRTNALSWWQHSSSPEANIEAIVEFVKSKIIVDQAAIMQVATAVVASRLTDSATATLALKEILDATGTADPWSFYASAWMMSKYSDAANLLLYFEQHATIWAAHDQTSRLVAGCLPLIIPLEARNKLRRIVMYSGNAAANSVLQFHDRLLDDPNGYHSIRRFLRAPNTSLPNKLSHSKVLMALSVFQNPDLDGRLKHELLKLHDFAFSDPWYRLTLERIGAF